MVYELLVRYPDGVRVVIATHATLDIAIKDALEYAEFLGLGIVSLRRVKK